MFITLFRNLKWNVNYIDNFTTTMNMAKTLHLVHKLLIAVSLEYLMCKWLQLSNK